MLTREKLLKIKELNLYGRLEKMDDGLLKEYCKIIDVFIERYPAQEIEIKDAFGAKDYITMSEVLLSVGKLLETIYANDLAKSCSKVIAKLEDSNQDAVEMLLSYLLTRISMLSIDIQMAKNEIKTDPRPADDKKNTSSEEKQKNILAVDDVSLTLNSLKMILHNTDYRLTCVNSGEAALKYLANHNPDLFILDIEMPNMDGYELAEKIRAKGYTAPIIFLTGNTTEDYLFKAIQAGAADFIVKPINTDFVLEKIQKQFG